MKSRALCAPTETPGGLPGLDGAKRISVSRVRRFSLPKTSRQSMHRQILAHVRTALLLRFGGRSASSNEVTGPKLRQQGSVPGSVHSWTKEPLQEGLDTPEYGTRAHLKDPVIAFNLIFCWRSGLWKTGPQTSTPDGQLDQVG